MTAPTPRGALAAVVGSTTVLLAAPFGVLVEAVPDAGAAGAFAAATVVNVVGFMALGARGRRAHGALALLGLVLAAGFALVLALPPTDPEAPVFWLGLPPRAAVAVYGLGFLPILGVPLIYAWTFAPPGPGSGR